MKSFILKFWPCFVIAIVVSIIAWTNNVAGTILTGGDNLHPEFNFLLNIKRSIFSVWEEYQGVGLLAGMGHAADLPRQLLLLAASYFMPMERIRFFWTILTLLIGSLGSYFLIRRIISETYKDLDNLKIQTVSLVGSVFYLLNLATLQQYFTAFEVFTAHFAFLPWLILVALNYFIKPTNKNLVIVGIISFLSLPGAYVPTLFVVYLLAVSVVSIFFIKRIKLMAIIKYFLVVFLINSFWLLPFIYFTISNASGVLDSKISQLASPSIFQQNKEYGDIQDVVLLKGFWFNNVEPNYQGVFVYMLDAWRKHLSNPLIASIGYLLFGIILTGVVQTVRKRRLLGLSLVAIFILSFTMLATATPPFSYIVSFLRDSVPLFKEVFRFPFTKFSLLAGLSFSIFLTIGILEISQLLKRFGARIYLPISLAVIFLILMFSFPTFKGNFFYFKEQIKIPSNYYDFFNYMKNQDPSLRVADFPQYQNWEWNFYDWGYSGSGFVWYGIPQPILSRTFDTWSYRNENYYWEITNALYAKDVARFNSVLNKYQVSKLYIDRAIVTPTTKRSLFINDLREMISQIPQIKKEKDFGSIELYSHELPQKPKSFVFALPKLPSVNSYKQAEFDSAYSELSNYFESKNPDIYFPFRSSLFSRKSQKDIDYALIKKNDYMEFSQVLPEESKNIKLTIPSPITKNNTLPIGITAEIKGTDFIVSYTLHSPSVYLEKQGKTSKVWESSFKKELFKISSEQKFPLKLNVNGAGNILLNTIEKDKPTLLGTGTLSITQDNHIVLSDVEGNVVDEETIQGESLGQYFSQDSSSFVLEKIDKDEKLLVRVSIVEDKYQGHVVNPLDLKDNVVSCDNFRDGTYSAKETEDSKLRLTSKNSAACLSINIKNLDHDQAYAIFLQSKTIKGKGMHFWVLNDNTAYSPLETYIQNKKEKTSTFVLSPMERFGLSYSFHLDNISIGQDEEINDIGKLEIYPIPYSFISTIYLGEAKIDNESKTPKLSINHPNESLYTIKNAQNKSDYTLVLSQGYNKGWQAYVVKDINFLSQALPFVFGKRIDSHVLVNNWENGWLMKGDEGKVILVFLPQYLEYAGFLVLGIIGISLTGLLIKRRVIKRT